MSGDCLARRVAVLGSHVDSVACTREEQRRVVAVERDVRAGREADRRRKRVGAGRDVDGAGLFALGELGVDLGTKVLLGFCRSDEE